MSADVVITTPSRTYRVPMALTASIGKEQATLDDVFNAMENIPAARAWSEKIIAGVQRDEEKRAEAVLASIEYDPDKYLYWGFAETAEDDFVFALARCPQDNLDLNVAEQYGKSGWEPVPGAITASAHGVAMDRDLLAFTASAFKDGCKGVCLVYGQPVMFLDEEPLLAAGPPDIINNEGNVYAVVDGMDTTAIMDVIMLMPGPQVFRRDGGAWVADQATLDAFMGTQPPPIVELTGPTKDEVIEQVDIAGAQQLAPDSEGGAETGEMLGVDPRQQMDNGVALDPKGKKAAEKSKTDSHKVKEPNKVTETPSQDAAKSNQDKSQLKDGSTAQMTAALLMHHENSTFATVVASAAGQTNDAKLSAISSRKESLSSILSASNHLRDRIHALDNVILPALMPIVAAGTENTSLKNKKGTAELRKYWLRGKGAAKIRWNTPGDFTRCERQLKKHLGDRAKGYCANLHKAATGVWPGDKKNVGKKG